LEERVGEPEDEQILDRFFSEIVIDAEDRRLGKDLVEYLVEALRRCEIAPERLLDDDASTFVELRRLEPLHDDREEFGRYREVERGVVAVLELGGQRGKCRLVGVLATYHAQSCGEPVERVLVDRIVRGLDRSAGIVVEVAVIPRRSSDPD